MRYRLLLFLLLLLPAWAAKAQAPNWQTVLGNSATVVRGSAANASGDYYVIGTYYGTLSLGGTAADLNSAGGTEDMFLAKFSGSTNTFVWAVSGGGSAGTEDGRAVAVNGNNIYVTGSYQTAATISGSSLTAVGSSLDMYVAKYVDNGTTVTSGGALTGGGGASDAGFSIAVNGTNVYVTGYMSANATTPVISGTTLTSAGGQDMFVARFSDGGTLGNGSAVSGGGGGLDRGLVVGVNSNGVYVTGYLSANAIAPTIQGAAASNAGGQDMFLAKYTATLGNAGVVSGGGSTNDQGQALTISGNTIYVAGTFTGTANIAGSSLTSAGLADMFVAKYTDSGSGLTNGFAARDGGANTEAVGDIAVTGTTLYVVGNFTTSTTLSGSSLTSNGLDAFVAKYTDLGSSLANLGAIDGGTDAPGTGTTAANTISLSGPQALVAGNVATPATFGSIALASGTAYVSKLAPASTTLTSIALGGSSPTNATSVTYTITFASSITGLSTSNFSLTATGTVAGASVTSVTGSGTTYTVTVNTGTGDGTLRLNLANDTGLSLAISNSPYTSGPAYTIDKTSPTVAITSSTAANGGSTGTSPIAYTVTFSENVTGFVSGDVTVANGTISGFTAVSGTVYTFNVTPTAIGAVTVTVPAAVAQDAASNFNTAAPASYTITFAAPTITVSPATLPNGAVATAYSQTITASGGTAPYSFAITAGALPAGLTLSSGGVLAGTPTAGGSFTFTVRATDASAAPGPYNGSRSYTLTIAAPTIAVSPATLPNGTVAAAYSQTITASGGTAPYGFAITAGALPAGLTLSSAGVLSGTPTAGGSFTFTVTATDASAGAGPYSGSRAYTLTIAAPTIAVAPATLPNGATGTAYSQTITASGGTAPYSFAITAGALPAGLTLSSGGVLAGTPTASGSFTFTVTATDASTGAGPYSGSRAYTLTIVNTSTTVVSVTGQTPSPTATAQVSYRVVFAASVSGVTTSNFSVNTLSSGISGASVSSVSGSGTTYTVVVNTGTGNGSLRLEVANSTGITPTVSNVPYTSGTTYAITKSFAAAPQLTIVGTGGTGSDVTAFVDVAQVLSGGSTFANGLQNGSFETHNPLANGDYGYNPTGATWTFNSQSGIAESGSAFTPTTPIPNGIAVAFVQSAGGGNGQLQQNLAVPTGSNYQVSFQTAQRVCCTTLDQALNVFLNGVYLGTIQPGSSSYSTFTSATFAVTAPALTATVSTTSSSPTSTSPIPFSVSFSQSVGTTFTASDVTVTGGTLNVGSFAGSGSGPYTFTVTPSGTGTVSVSLAANVANDANNTQNTTSNTVSVQYVQPVTAAPVVTAPANGSFVNTTTPTYTGTAVAGSTVTVSVDGTAIGTTTATAGGTFSLAQPTALAQGSHTVRATAQTIGSAVSVNSNTNTFTVDTVQPTVAITSSTATNGGSTGTSPIAYTVTFSEAVTGFVAGDVTVTNGTISGFTAVSGTVYTFNVTPTANGAVTVNVPVAVAQDQASNFNTAAPSAYTITYTQPVVAVAQNVTVQLNANGTATLNASSVNNGSTGAPTLTYTIQKVVYGQVPEGQTLTLSTPTGENFSAIRFASYGTPTGSNGNYTLGGCNASNSAAVVGGILIGNPSGSIGANNTTFGDPCGGTPKSLAVVAAYSANAASLPYTCANVAGPNYVLLTVTDGNGNTSTMTAQVTVLAPPTASFTLNPTSGNIGAPITASGSNLGGATALTVNGAAATISNLTANGFTFVVPAGATVGLGSVVLTTPCSQSPSAAITVTQPVTAAPVVTSPGNGNLTNTTTPAYSGTAVANSTVTVSVDGTSIGTTTATAGGMFSLTQPTALAQGSHTVYATAQTSGSSVSANSATNTFTVDTVQPTVAISSTAGASGSNTTTTPIPFTVTFSEAVTGFVAGDVTVTNGTIGTVSGSGTTYTFSVTPTTAGTATTVNVPAAVAQDAAGNFNTAASSAYSLTYQPTAVTWNGSISSDWFTAGNWTPAVVPTTAIDASIPASAPNMPAIGASTANVRNLTINSGATLTQTGGTLALAANLTNNGTYQPTGGTSSLGGTTLSNILGSSNTRFWNLTVGASGAQSSTSASTSVQRLFTLNGNFATNGNPLTMESNAANTALVVNNSGVITGNVTVQRYIAPDLNAGLGYRHFSASVSNATVGSLTTASFTPVVNPTYNTSATPNSERPFPTVYRYDQVRLATATNNLAAFDKGWTSPGALTDPLTVGQGYTVNLAANQTLSMAGPQNNGTVSQALNRNSGATAPDAGWQLVGNPYPSPLDYSLVAPADRLGLDAAMYVFESTSQYGGTYRANVNGVGGNANSPNAVLALGQGFFVRVSNGQTSGSLTLRNSQRLTSYTNPVYHRTTETRPLVQLDLQSATGSDPLYVYFEQAATAGTDPEFDAVKLPNSTGLNLAAWAGSDKMAINGLPLTSTASVTVPLFIGLPVTGTYTLHAAQVLNFGAGEQPFLRDLQLGTLTDLSLHPNYTFTMNAANNTPRFELVFGARVLGVASAKLAAQVAVYPNPASKAVFVELPFALNRKAVTAALVDGLGRVVLTQALPAGLPTYTLPLTNLATGVYSLRLQTEAGVVVKKLVVE